MDQLTPQVYQLHRTETIARSEVSHPGLAPGQGDEDDDANQDEGGDDHQHALVAEVEAAAVDLRDGGRRVLADDAVAGVVGADPFVESEPEGRAAAATPAVGRGGAAGLRHDH